MSARNRIRRLISWCSRFCGPVILQKLFSPRRRARILIYHSISDDPHNPFAVSPRAFHDQMEHLARHCTVVSLPELASMVRDGRDIPRHCVVVTFDDGYEDNYVHAFPVLKKFRIPVTIFLVADSIREDAATIKTTDTGNITFMTWDQVREMARNGITFGSHTLTHPSLALLEPAETARELRESRSLIEDRLGSPVTGVAYPYGTFRDVNLDVIDAAREAGYTHACMAINGTCGRQTDIFALPRTKIEYGDSHEIFKQALDGALDVFILLDWIRMLLGKRDPGALGKIQGNR